ncbi:MAG: hypothetical protein H8E48_11490 [Chloroflexi bacterium]|nr:hypothetical protein [Chloroflexota bacterium]
MTDIVLECTRAVIMLFILGYLLWIGRREELHHQKGWLHIIFGFALVFFGSLIDITDNFESLNRFVVIGDTVTEAYLEKVGGFLFGFGLILVGFLHWLPLVAAVRKNQEDLLKYNEELGDQVAARTADLTLINERLVEEIDARESLAKFPSEDPSPVLRIALDGTVLYANAAGSPILDDWNCKIGETAPSVWRESVAEVLSSNANTEIECQIDECAFSFILAPVEKANYANLYGRDITILKEIDRMKDDFLTMVSHELRTPLTGIKGSAEILQTYDDIDTETQRQFISIINSECDRLTRLINDVLDLSRIESGKDQWHMTPVLMSEVIETAVNAAHALVDQKGLSLALDVEPDVPPVWGDEDKLVQVMTNLLGNAIKFTSDDGKIGIKVRSVAGVGPEDAPSICVSVSDTGIGISPADCQEVFEKFKQVSDTRSERPKGTGLGLPICNEIIRYLGGQMSLESELGNGSTFSFTLPSKG